MNITLDTTIREIVEKYPDCLPIFVIHGVDVEGECPEELWDTALSDCESMCHIDDINELVKELNAAKLSSTK